MSVMQYRVAVDDNFDFMDEDARDEGVTYETAEGALAAAQLIVNKSLRNLYATGFTPEQLLDAYMDFGDDPFIVSDDPTCKFSAWDYAATRCSAICEEMAAGPPPSVVGAIPRERPMDNAAKIKALANPETASSQELTWNEAKRGPAPSPPAGWEWWLDQETDSLYLIKKASA
jgi:hypothetical protein